jgi:antitoxin StbD
MTGLLTPQICTMTELREPQKVLDRAGGKTVAILKNSALVGYLVPAESVARVPEQTPLSREALKDLLVRTRETAQPVLDYLRDK